MTSKFERVETAQIVVEGVSAKVSIRIWEPMQAKASVVCVHGFAGTNHDFTVLAHALAKDGVSLIAPDMFGRGESTFFDESSLYKLRNQLLVLAETERYQQQKNCFLGTSWGGLIALAQVAVMRWRINGLVLNDCPVHSNARVREYYSILGEESRRSFDTRRDAEEYVVDSRSLQFLQGKLRDRILRSRIKMREGRWGLSYDPALCSNPGDEFKFSVAEILSRASKPVLMNFGDLSPYATDPVNEKIAKDNSNIQLLTSMSASHPPSLMKADEVIVIKNFILSCFD